MPRSRTDSLPGLAWAYVCAPSPWPDHPLPQEDNQVTTSVAEVWAPSTWTRCPRRKVLFSALCQNTDFPSEVVPMVPSTTAAAGHQPPSYARVHAGSHSLDLIRCCWPNVNLAYQGITATRNALRRRSCGTLRVLCRTKGLHVSASCALTNRVRCGSSVGSSTG